MRTRTKPAHGVAHKPKPTEKVSRYIRIDVTIPMHRALRLLAAQEDVNMSVLLRGIIKKHLDAPPR